MKFFHYIIGVFVLLMPFHGINASNPQRNLGANQAFRESVLNHDFSSFSCEALNELPGMERETLCDFAKTCNDGDGLFAPVVFCHPSLSTNTILWIISLPLVIYLLVLFRVLGSTAEGFFSPGLEMLSLKLGVPERFAGVTLLSFGNGAPDVAATVSAITNDKKRGYLLALGELTGAAMVASTLIVGVVIYVADGVPCTGGLIRDVVVFILTMAAVFKSFEDGTITATEVHGLVALYIVYALLVLGSDLYHRRIIEPKLRQRRDSIASSAAHEMDSEGQSSLQQFSGEETLLLHESTQKTKIPASDVSGELTEFGKLERAIEALSNYDEVNQDSSPPHRDFLLKRESSSLSTGWAQRGDDGEEPILVFHPHHGGVIDIKHAHSDENATRPPPDGYKDDSVIGSASDLVPNSWSDAIGLAPTELREHLGRQIWNFSGDERQPNILEKILLAFELPFTILRMLSIPVPTDYHYCRPLLALSVALSPLWMLFYFWKQFDWEIGITLVIKWTLPFLVLGVLVLRFGPRGQFPMKSLWATVPLTLLGFAVSATWLDLIADQLVSVLSFFGIMLHIPSTIMGLTVLAWGNSTQDLIANFTLAKKGLSKMAVTASFAGPVFNILVGLGIGLTILVNSNAGEPIPVHLNPTLFAGFIFAVLNGLLVIVAGTCFGKGKISKRFGFVAMVMYAVYAIVSIGAGGD